MLDRVVERGNDDDCPKKVVFFDPRRRDDLYFISPVRKRILADSNKLGIQ